MIEVRDIQDFSDYLDTLLNQTECDDIEFKSAAGGFPDSFGILTLLLPIRMAEPLYSV